MKAANQRQQLTPPSTIETLISYGIKTFESLQEEISQLGFEAPSLASTIQSWSDALSNYELTNNLTAAFDPSLHWDQESIKLARVMKVINDQQNSAYALPQKRRSKPKTATKSCSRCDRTGHVVSQCFAKAKADGSPC